MALVPVLGVWNNLVVHRLPGRPGSYVVANVAATAVLLAAARVSGLSWAELGLDRRRLAAGARWGGACAAVVAAGYAAALALPAVRPLLADARAAGLDGGDLADGPLARTGAVVLACLGTAAAGVLFTGLRERSGSLLAPVLLHLATNTLGLGAAAAAHR